VDDGRLDVEVSGPVATVLINNPARRNAMTVAMWTALPGILDRLAVDPAVKVVILSGAGGTFCAGADINDAAAIGREGEGSVAVRAEDALAAFAKPTIARIEGFCVGGGCQLAVACDLRYAATGSRFGITPAKLGIVYPAVTTRRLVELVGPAAAKHLLFTGELIGVERAVRVGLVDEELPAAELADVVLATAHTIASRSQLSVAAAKDLIGMAARGDVDGVRVAYWRRQAAESTDLAEGIAAFRERREPSFTWSRSTEIG
jgi:enoyl-CoA hydratase/carnithine racemase